MYTQWTETFVHLYDNTKLKIIYFTAFCLRWFSRKPVSPSQKITTFLTKNVIS